MGEEITRILKLLEDGKINSEEAERLINAVSGKKQQGFFVPAPPKIPKEFLVKMGDYSPNRSERPCPRPSARSEPPEAEGPSTISTGWRSK